MKIDFDRIQLMGILNATPDSFFDGGKYNDIKFALQRAKNLISAGAKIIDIGGESTRPGSDRIDAKTEFARIADIIEAVRGVTSLPISVDTYKALVADQAIQKGATIINDVSGADIDPEILVVASERNAKYVLTYNRQEPISDELDLIDDAKRFLDEKLLQCEEVGINKENIIFDIGIGFGKSYDQNFDILGRVSELSDLHFDLMVGNSRKSFLQRRLGKGVDQMLSATLAANFYSIQNGVTIVRTHDVLEQMQFLQIWDTLGKDNEHSRIDR